MCDELGYVSCEKEGGEVVFKEVWLRGGKKGRMISNNLGFKRWNKMIKEKVVVGGMVERVRDKGYVVNMRGVCYRVKEREKMREDK